MATLVQRKVGAVIGAAVADAAAQPLHWIYDLQKLDTVIGDKEDFEFFTPSANPFYCIETGKQSCYGDQAYVILESLVDQKGLNVEDLVKKTYKQFGPGSEYDSSEVDAYKWKGTPQKNYPVKNPWRHFSIKDFLRKVEEGCKETGSEKDEQIDCVTKIAPLVALYAGRPEMLEKVEDAIRVTQNSDIDVVIGCAAARMLEKYILNGPSDTVIEEVIADLKSPKRHYPLELDNAVAAQLSEVLDAKDLPHKEAVLQRFINS